MRWEEREGAERQNPRTAQSFCVAKAAISANAYDLSLNRYKEIEHEKVEHASPAMIIAELKLLEAEIATGIRKIEGALR